MCRPDVVRAIVRKVSPALVFRAPEADRRRGLRDKRDAHQEQRPQTCRQKVVDGVVPDGAARRGVYRLPIHPHTIADYAYESKRKAL